MKKETLTFSILMPVYNVSQTIKDTLKSVLGQSYRNFMVIIQDNDSADDTLKIIKSFKDKRIKVHKNVINLGYSRNLIEGKKHCTGDIIFLMAGDDILHRDALLHTYNAYMKSDKIAAVARPYFWFDASPSKPVRIKKSLSTSDEIVHITDASTKVFTVLSTIDQLSGLSFRRSFMKEEFSLDPWIAHGYPFLAIFAKHPIVFLHTYTVAVRIWNNTSRSNIYQKSPMLSWIDLINETVKDRKLKKIKKLIISDFIARNYIGLIQIKNFGNYSSLMREIYLLVKYRPANLYSPTFWTFVGISTIIPSFLLNRLTDTYKRLFLAKLLPTIDFKHS